jgi:hypothetical protein
VLIRDRFPAYLSWDQFEAHQKQLDENSRRSKLLSAPRHGPSVLAGLVGCGRCGRRMLVGNSVAGGPSSAKTLRYTCQRDALDYGTERCQSLSGAALETLVVERLLQAVAPASLELSLAAAEDIERERRQLDEHWRQRLARSRYDVEQARRQYAAVEPEHRLVARELERRWDDAIRAEEHLQVDYKQFQQENPSQLAPHEREQIRALAQDLPALWAADSTTPEDRQAIARLLLEQVVVTVEGESDRADVELRWAGGFVSRHALARPVQAYEQLANYQELVARVETLRTERKTLAEIAATLNAEGFRPPKRASQFTKGMVSRFLLERQARRGTRTPRLPDVRHLEANEWWLANLACELSMPIATLHRWQRVGWVVARKVAAARGQWAITADAQELIRLRRLRDALHSWHRPYPPELTRPRSCSERDEATPEAQC